MSMRLAYFTKSLRLAATLTLVLCMSGTAWSDSIIFGSGSGELGTGANLSDFQQSYGQVTAAELNLDNPVVVTNFSVWGLYYNYSGDWGNTPPVEDDFTIRLHSIDAGDPNENYYYEASLGAGTRTATGNSLGSYPLDIYRYDFTGLSIAIGSGNHLFSLINSTVNPATNGYWHWVSVNPEYQSAEDDAWWRRENAHSYFSPGSGDYETYNWLPEDIYTQNISLVANGYETPEPASMLLFGSAIAGFAAYRRRQRKKGVS
jgi:hypothetical protein